MTLLDRVVDVYAQLLPLLADGGAEWVQFDEPILVTDVPPSTLAAAEHAYERLCGLSDRPKLLVATYFDVLGDALGCCDVLPSMGLPLTSLVRQRAISICSHEPAGYRAGG